MTCREGRIDMGIQNDPTAEERPRGGRLRMRAIRLTGPGRIGAVSAPAPRPGPGEALIRLEGCGVCASNLEPWAGPDWMSFPTEPGAPGHEGWGVVEEVGPGAAGLAPGMRVATLGQRSYATHEILPAGLVAELPPGLHGRPFPGEPLGCAMNILRRSHIRAGALVAVVGVGFIGALLVRLASAAGAEVVAISRRKEALAAAARMGAAVTIPLGREEEAIERVRDLSGGRMCEVAIEAGGAQRTLDLASGLTAVGGRLVIAGYHQDGPRQIDMQSWNWRGIEVTNAHERDPQVCMRGLREAIAAAAEGRLEPWPLLTHSYPLARLDAALNATRDKPDGFMKAVVTCA